MSTYRYDYIREQPITVAVLSKAWVCCRLIDGIAGSNPVEGTDVRLLCLLCVVWVAAPAKGLITRSEESYRVCVCVWDLESSSNVGLRPS